MLDSDNEIKFEFVGWNNKGTSDKLWGIVSLDDKFYSFWGRRNGKLQFKEEEFPKKGWAGLRSSYNREPFRPLIYLEDAVTKKIKKGYYDFTKKLEEIDPNFKTDFVNNLFISKLTSKVRNKYNMLNND